MSKQKLEITKALKGNGLFDASKMTITIGDEVIDLKEKLQMFNGETIKFGFALSDVLAEGKGD